MTTAKFLDALFGQGIQKDRRLAIWTLADKRTKLFDDTEAAAKYAAGVKGDCYFGVGLIAGKPEGRGKFNDVAAIGGLWADIDIAGPGHKKGNLPPDERTARALLDRAGVEPSIIVHSGHGLQAYWLFKEPWVFDTPEERHEAAKLARRWVSTLRAVAGAEGYDLDAVGDITRVMRVPGTTNCKGDPVDVRILDADEQLGYAPDDFEPYLVAEEYEPDHPDEQLVQVGVLTLRRDSEPPGTKLAALVENDDQFRKSWNRKRRDFSDQSASSYDMSIATIAARAGWTDQEVANLIIAWRREHGEDVDKAMRRDYLQRTIAKAKAGVESERAMAELGDVATAASAVPAKTPEEAAQRRQKLLRHLSATFGVKIARWVQHGREDARYSLLLGDGTWVRMGGTENVLSSKKFRTKLYEATGVMLGTFKVERWHDVCRCLAAAAEFIENEEATSAYQAEEWVRDYLDVRPPAQEDEWQEAAACKHPFYRDGALHVHTSELRQHLRIEGERISRADLCDCLKVSGYERVDVHAWFNGKTIARSYWRKTPSHIKKERDSTNLQDGSHM